MSRVRAFFVEEATECLGAMRAELAAAAPHTGVLHAAARQLRGSAQMARFGQLTDAAWSLEQALKAAARGDRPWDEALQRRVADEVDALARGVEAVRAGRMEPDEKESGMDEQASTTTHDPDAAPIERFEYRGAAALERARTLRAPLEAAIEGGEPAGPILDELFDLIRLGTK